MMLRIIAASSLTILTATAAIGSLPENPGSETRAARTTSIEVATGASSKTALDDDRSGMSKPSPIAPVRAKGQPQWGSPSIALTAEMLEASNVAEQVTMNRRPGSMHKSLDILPALEVAKKPVALKNLPTNENGDYLGTGRLLIKFKNDVKARASIFPGMPVVSLTGRNTLQLNDIVERSGATVRQAINMTDAEIEKVRQICFDRSNRIQPDFASMMKVEFPGQKTPNWPEILRTAKAINELPEIEYVHFEPILSIDQNAQNCDDPPDYKCNRPNPDFSPDTCWNGSDNTPGVLTNPECNEFQCQGASCIVGCNDGGCCNTVANNQLYAYCNDEDNTRGWDVACAAYANTVCNGTVYTPTDNPNLAFPDRYDPCLSTYDPDCGGADGCTSDPLQAQRRGVFGQMAASLLGSCYEANPEGVGCQSPACCASVCVVHPVCCTQAWDEDCAGFANSGDYDACTGDDAGDVPTPVMGMGAPYLYMPQLGSPGTRPTVADWGDIEGAWPPSEDNWNSYFTCATYGSSAFRPTDPLQIPEWEAFIDAGYQGWGGTGLDVDLAAQTAGVIWRLYGGGAIDPVIPNPNLVWLGGAEWEVLPAAECTTGDCYDFGGSWDETTKRYTPRPLPTPANPQDQLTHPFTAFCADLNTNYTLLRLKPTGKRQDVAICEFSAYVLHEEWTEVLSVPTDFTSDRLASTVNNIIVEPGVEMELTNTENANHGLASLGVTVAPNNGFGVTGIAPYAQGWFFPIESVNEGARVETCFASMINLLPEGAVVSNSWGIKGSCGGERQPLSGPYYTLIRAMADAGLVVLQSAGNDSSRMGAEGNTGQDSGLIKVGAAYAGIPLFLNPNGGPCEAIQCSGRYQRIGFSNFSTADTAGSVDMFAWGELGLTTGTGGLFRGQDNRPGINPIERQYTRSYQGPGPNGPGGYNGTSFACPQVAGSMALLQGAARMFWNQPFNGDLMKQACGIAPNSEAGANFDNANEQCGIRGYPSCVDVCPESAGLLNRKNENCQDCAGVYTSIGVAVRFREQMISVVTTPIVTPGDSLVVYTGDLVAGGVISITSNDGAVATVISEFAASGPGPNGVPYFGTGQTIDWGATLRTNISAATIQEAQIISVARANGSLNIEIPFLKNQITGRWDYLGSSILTPITAPNIYPLNTFGNAGAYFLGDYRVEIRMYTIGLGFSTGGGFAGSWDFVTVDQAEPVEPI